MSAPDEYLAWYKGLDTMAQVGRMLVHEGRCPVVVYGTIADKYFPVIEGGTVFGGWKDKVAIFEGARVLLHPSRRDPFPVAVMEAMLAGVPVVVGRAGNASIVGSVEPRLVVPPDDATAAKRALDWVTGLSDDEYVTLGLKLRGAIMSYLAWAESTEALEPVLRIFDRRPKARHVGKP